MASVVTKYINNLQSISDKMEIIAKDAVIQNAEFIIFTLTERQLALGLNSAGAISGRYAPYTSLKASDPYNQPRREKRRGEPYNWDWSGELFETMNVKAESDSFSIFSTTGKDKMLEAHFKMKLTKLTEENNKMINETIILPYLMKYLLDHLMDV